MAIGRGVRKVNESIIQDGRTLIVTEETDANLDWDRLPDGTLKIHPVTGAMEIKVRGEAGWLPAGLTHNGTITIAKDAKIVYEVFTVKRPNNGDGTFTYIKEDGEERTKPLTADGKQAFELEKGSYILKRNKIEAIINDALVRSATSGGLVEIDETRVSLTATKVAGTKVTLKYFQKINIGNPYPRFWINENIPEQAEYGDFWLDIKNGMSVLKWWNGLAWKKISSDEFRTVVGGNRVFKGFGVTPGTGRTVNITKGADTESVLFIDGAQYFETGAPVATITANSSGSSRTDSLYAEVSGNGLIYKVAAGTASVPANACKLASIEVPNGASTIIAGNITLVDKAISMSALADDIHAATASATAGTLARRDASGRMKAAAPSAATDVARKSETDAAMSAAAAAQATADAAVRRAGDTMTGALNIEGYGVFPRRAVLTAATSGASYDLGITVFKDITVSGFPVAQATILNIKPTADAMVQKVYSAAGTLVRSFVRHWSTSDGWTAFREMSDLTLGETSLTAYRGDRGKAAYDHSVIVNENPHNTSHNQIKSLTFAAGLASSADGTAFKHVSDAMAQKWEDHVVTTATGSNPHNSTFASMKDATVTSPINGNVLRHNGTAWVNSTLAAAGIQPTITGAASTISSSNLTTLRALISDTNGKVVASAITSDELAHLNGVTSSLQTQLNNRVQGSVSGQKVYAQSAKPTSGMNAGDIWIDTGVSYGTK